MTQTFYYLGASHEIFSRDGSFEVRAPHLLEYVMVFSKLHQPSYSTLFRELTQTASLEDNWDGYGSRAPTRSAIGMADDLIRKCGQLNMLPDTVRASGEGGLCLIFEREGLDGAIEIHESGDIVAVVTEEGRDLPRAWLISDEEDDLRTLVDALRPGSRRASSSGESERGQRLHQQAAGEPFHRNFRIQAQYCGHQEGTRPILELGALQRYA